MARKKAVRKEEDTKVEESVEEVKEEPVEESKKEEDTKGGSSAVVKDGSRVVRTYSKEKHGKDFKKLAEEYVSSRGNLEIEIV